jgi:uncharacterized protein (UPF0276 family)
VGLSIGTDLPLDEAYLEKVAQAISDLKMLSYSEHLAWTKAPGMDLANLLPVPKNHQVADALVEKIKVIQTYIPVPFSLENISYIFDYPDSVLSDAEFFSLIFRETGVNMLLHLENLYIYSVNNKFDRYAFLNQLPPNIVSGIHVAGGAVVSRDYLQGPVWIDSHSEPVPDEVMVLLDRALSDQRPQTIVLERDDGLAKLEEILSDVVRICDRIGGRHKTQPHAEHTAIGSSN